MKKANLTITAFGLFILLSACQSPPKTNEDTAKEDASVVALPTQKVKVITAEVRPFAKEYGLNGKIVAHQTLSVKSEMSGRLVDFRWREGQRVSKGDKLLQLDTRLAEQKIIDQEIQLEKARLARDEKSMLVSGESYGVDSTLTEQQREYIAISSGYNEAVQALANAKSELLRLSQYAPYSGVISDIEVKNGELINAGTATMNLINPSSYEVEYKALESVAIHLRKGQKITFAPVHAPDQRHTAIISTINPKVDQQGLVKIKAKVSNGHRQLMEGMNVAVTILYQTPSMIVLPTSALVLRSGKEVVFVYDEASRLAKWKYVTVSHKNSKSIALSEGIEPGDQVIIEGNLNLAHDARVVIDTTLDQ